MKRIFKPLSRHRPLAADAIVDLSCQITWDQKAEVEAGAQPKYADLSDADRENLRRQLRDHVEGGDET